MKIKIVIFSIITIIIVLYFLFKNKEENQNIISKNEILISRLEELIYRLEKLDKLSPSNFDISRK